MSLRLWRRKTIIPGLRINLSKSGVSLSVGHKGAWLTSGPRGRRVTVGLPGSGLFWTQKLPPARAPRTSRHRLALAIVLLIIVLAVLAAAVGGRPA